MEKVVKNPNTFWVRLAKTWSGKLPNTTCDLWINVIWSIFLWVGIILICAIILLCDILCVYHWAKNMEVDVSEIFCMVLSLLILTFCMVLSLLILTFYCCDLFEEKIKPKYCKEIEWEKVD